MRSVANKPVRLRLPLLLIMQPSVRRVTARAVVDHALLHCCSGPGAPQLRLATAAPAK
jgi:hypothetical protein